MGRFRHLHPNTGRCKLDMLVLVAAKPFNTEINVTVDDIEIEARGSTTLGQRYLALRKLLETKDMMIEHLVEE